MFSGDSMVFDLFLELNTRYFEHDEHSLKMSDKQFPAIRVP